jgi:acid stress chaperone HdeA
MKSLKVLAVVACLFVAHAASAQEKPKPISPAKMTCADFVAVDEVYRPSLVYWVAGVDKLGVRETDTLVVDTAHPVGEMVAQECRKDPHAPFMSKVRSMIKTNQVTLFDHH